MERRPSQSARGGTEELPSLAIRPLYTCALLNLFPAFSSASIALPFGMRGILALGLGLGCLFLFWWVCWVVLCLPFGFGSPSCKLLRAGLAMNTSCVPLRKSSKVSALGAGWGGLGFLLVLFRFAGFVGRWVGLRFADTLLIRMHIFLRPLLDGSLICLRQSTPFFN